MAVTAGPEGRAEMMHFARETRLDRRRLAATLATAAVLALTLALGCAGAGALLASELCRVTRWDGLTLLRAPMGLTSAALMARARPA